MSTAGPNLTGAVRPGRDRSFVTGIGCLILGGVILAYTSILLALSNGAQTVPAGRTYAWDDSGPLFVQSATDTSLFGGKPECVIRAGGAERSHIAFRRSPTSLIPGELVDRPDAASVTVTCDKEVRVTTGFVGHLYLISGSRGDPYIGGALVLTGLVILIVRRFRGKAATR